LDATIVIRCPRVLPISVLNTRWGMGAITMVEDFFGA
jgi:hypothetical protein